MRNPGQEAREKLGNVIQQARKTRGLTQTELAGMVGVQQTSISSWEKGHQAPERWRLPDIEIALGLESGQLARIYDGDLGEPPEPVPWSPLDSIAEIRRALDQLQSWAEQHRREGDP